MFSNYVLVEYPNSGKNCYHRVATTILEQVSISVRVDTSTAGNVHPCLHERYLLVTKGTDVIFRGTPGEGDFLLSSARLEGCSDFCLTISKDDKVFLCTPYN